MSHVGVRERLTPEEITQVTDLVRRATDADGVGPLSEHVLLHLRYGGEPPARSLLLYTGSGTGTLAGYAHLDPTDEVEGPSAEMVVEPAHRGHGHGRALAAALLTEAARFQRTGSPGHAWLRLWAHGEMPAAAALAESMGFDRIRALWQMRRPLDSPLPEVRLPEGVRLRTFEPGHDEEAWTELNRLAFAEHPEQGAWTVEDLLRREREPWFDPRGFFLAKRDGRLVGFHWTKVHGGSGTDGHGHEPIGEVYVVGVLPDERGSGLGKALTLTGLHHLRSLGLAQVMLYADEGNTPAIKLYESLGFTHHDTDVMYRR